MTAVRWGVLGAGWLVERATGAAIHNAADATFLAAGARDLQRARATGAERAYDSYASVIDDPDIDAVYICLHNDAHLPWILAALEAGKHVLCEKPLVMSAAEAERAFAAAEAAGVLLVEAMWTRWHPRMRRIADLATSGSLGRIESYVGTFTFLGVAEGNYRLSAARGGGALYDVGVYPLHGLRALLPGVEELDIVEVEHVMGGDGVDLTTTASLAWADGTLASVVGSFAIEASQRLEVRGSEGRIVVDDNEAWASWREATSLVVDGHVESFEPVDAYQLMFEEVSAAILGRGGWVLPPADSVCVARWVDSLLP